MHCIHAMASKGFNRTMSHALRRRRYQAAFPGVQTRTIKFVRYAHLQKLDYFRRIAQERLVPFSLARAPLYPAVKDLLRRKQRHLAVAVVFREYLAQQGAPVQQLPWEAQSIRAVNRRVSTVQMYYCATLRTFIRHGIPCTERYQASWTSCQLQYDFVPVDSQDL